MNYITEISNFTPTDFKTVLDTTLAMYQAIFLLLLLCLCSFIHSLMLQTFPEYFPCAWNCAKHNEAGEKIHQRLTDLLKKQGRWPGGFGKLSLSDATLIVFLVSAKGFRGSPLPTVWSPNSLLSLFSNPSVIWLLSHLLSITFIQQHLLSINHAPDTVLEYWNAMLSDKDLGLALLELTNITQIITLIQDEAFP